MSELNLSQEELDALMALGIAPEELTENRRKSELAELLRYGKGPEGRQNSRVYVAANPLEHIQNAVQRYKAKKEMKDLGLKREDILQSIRQGRGVFSNLLRGRGQLDPFGAGADELDTPISVKPPGTIPGLNVPPIGPIASRTPTTPPIVPAPAPPMATPPVAPVAPKPQPPVVPAPNVDRSAGAGPALLAWLLRMKQRGGR